MSNTEAEIIPVQIPETTISSEEESVIIDGDDTPGCKSMDVHSFCDDELCTVCIDREEEEFNKICMDDECDDLCDGCDDCGAACSQECECEGPMGHCGDDSLTEEGWQ